MTVMKGHDELEISQMEEQSKFKIITIADDNDDPAEFDIVQNACEKLQQLYSEFREWMKKNQDSEQFQQKKKWLYEESERIIEKTMSQIEKIKQDERTQEAISKGVKFANDAGEWIYHNTQFVWNECKNSETGHKIAEKVNEMKKDERVAQKIKDFKKSALQVSEKAYMGLKKILDTENEDKEEVMQNEKDNHL